MAQLDPTSFPDFYQGYVALVREDNPIDALTEAALLRKDLLSEWPDDIREFRYAPGKWTVKDLMLHLVDSERIFVYRALRFSRRDQTDLPGFDHNTYVDEAFANSRTFKSLYKEMRQQRKATVQFFKGLNTEQLQCHGTANGLAVSVEQLAYIIAGHERHHLNVLREKYLVAAGR